jgi:WD40 repeat protein/ABC-type phosphate transport system substrate-binding protein
MQSSGRVSFLLVGLMISSVLIWTPMVSAADGDGDGFDDAVDDCPFASGSSTIDRTGCPDADQDGTSDTAQGTSADYQDAVAAVYVETTGGGWGGSSSQSRALTVSNTGDFIAGADSGDAIILFAGSGKIKTTLATIGSNPRALDLSPNETLLAVSGYGFEGNGANVLVFTMDWQALTATVLVNLSANHYDDTFALRFSPDGSKLFVGGEDRNVTTYSTVNWSILNLISSGNDDIYTIDTSPDGRLIAFTHGQELSVHWASNGSQVWNMHNHSGAVTGMDWSPDGLWIVTGGDDEFWRVYHAANGSLEQEVYVQSDVNAVAFNKAGSHLVIAKDSGSETNIYSTADWSPLHEFGSFSGGSGQGASGRRGAKAVAWSDDETKIYFGAKYRGRVYTYYSQDAYIWLGGDVTGELMENRFEEYGDSHGDYLPNHYNTSVTQVTQSQCSGVNPFGNAPLIGASTSTAAEGLTTKLTNYTTSGMRTCDQNGDVLIDVPVARMPAVIFVKPNSAASACITTMGGLSMGQMRWIISGASENTLTTDGIHPGVTMSSIVPDDDDDGEVEWRDLDSSCAAEPIHLQHRWENRSVPQMISAFMLCDHCAFPENWFAPDFDRLRLAMEVRGDIINGVASNDHLIGITELRVGIAATTVHHVPLIDNWTHGAADALAAGGVAIDASVNNSREGVWPFQDDYRLVIREEELPLVSDFVEWMLSEEGQDNFDEIGFVRLSPEARVAAGDRIGINLRHILPDDDFDGIWNGEDNCPNTDLGANVDAYGCAQNQLDDDGDGLVNTADDCPQQYGTSTLPTVGCPDGDGDGWADTSDAFPTEPSQWADQDGDGYGDEEAGFESDACPLQAGQSTLDRFGCADSDGDGWSDLYDLFPNDPAQWADADGDGYGDNYSFSDVVDGVRIGEAGDAFPNDITQFRNRDGDGYGDNASGFLADTCPGQYGTSNQNGKLGCPDSDGDGWSDGDDAFPDEVTQYSDEDGDGYGDSLSGVNADGCPGTPAAEIQLVDGMGCAPSERDGDADGVSDADDLCPNTPVDEALDVDASGCSESERDSDGDGVLDSNDLYPDDETQSADTDGDGLGNNASGLNGDDCPLEYGTSTGNLQGCIDDDQDGWANIEDILPNNPTQWADSDGDGYYDNFDSILWRDDDMREAGDWPGELTTGARDPDRCPMHANSFQNLENPGCPDDLFPSGETDETPDGNQGGNTGAADGGMSTTALVLIIIAVIVLAILAAAAVIVLKKPKKGRSRNIVTTRDSTSEVVETEAEDEVSLEDDPNYKVDENDCEWWYDEGVWWYRKPDMEDWAELEG